MMLALASPLASQDDRFFSYENCPLTRLIASPSVHNGKLVKVVGYVVVTVEDGAVLCPTAEHARVHIPPEAVRLHFDESYTPSGIQALSRTYAQVFARFDSELCGDYAGPIREIYKTVGWWQ
jgi:hypothetical protein